MSKHTVLIQFTEPDSAGGTLHNPGEVADLDPVKVFDLADLIAQGVVGPAIEDAALPQNASFVGGKNKKPTTEVSAEPPATEVTTNDQS